MTQAVPIENPGAQIDISARVNAIVEMARAFEGQVRSVLERGTDIEIRAVLFALRHTHDQFAQVVRDEGFPISHSTGQWRLTREDVSEERREAVLRALATLQFLSAMETCLCMGLLNSQNALPRRREAPVVRSEGAQKGKNYSTALDLLGMRTKAFLESVGPKTSESAR